MGTVLDVVASDGEERQLNILKGPPKQIFIPNGRTLTDMNSGASLSAFVLVTVPLLIGVHREQPRLMAPWLVFGLLGFALQLIFIVKGLVETVKITTE